MFEGYSVDGIPKITTQWHKVQMITCYTKLPTATYQQLDAKT
jgi:hypothetical protein